MKLSTRLITSLVAMLALGMGACTMNQAKHYNSIVAGDLFMLHKPLTVKAGTTRAFIQNGEQVRKNDFSRFSQHCRLELHDLSPVDVVIQPDRFLIETVYTDEEMIATSQPAIQLASLNRVAFIDPNPDGVPESFELVHFELKSDRQKNVYRLTCSASISDGNPLDEPDSIRPEKPQINKTLGIYGTIE